MSAEKRALLVGVTQYRHKRREGRELADKNMPSAAADVAAFRDALDGEGFSTVCLTSEADTTRDSLLAALDLLFKDVPFGSTLVLYYSGHSMRIPGVDIDPRVKDEALCPSDTDWQRFHITDRELMQRISSMPLYGGSVEIILETCSAGGVPDGQLTRRFGRVNPLVVAPPRVELRIDPVSFAPRPGTTVRDVVVGAMGNILRGRCVFWGASEASTCSYSGPESPRGSGPAAGLFTRYFIEGFKRGLDRQTLRDTIEKRLETYRSEHRRWHRAVSRNAAKVRCMATKQVPYVDYLELQSPLAAKRPILGW